MGCLFLEGAALSFEQKKRVDDLFRAFALRHTKDELMQEGQRRRVQVAKEQTVDDIMEDSHLNEREYFVRVEHPELGDTITYGGAPFKATKMTWRCSRRAPLIGEHNQEIYGGELGLSQQELAVLKEGDVI